MEDDNVTFIQSLIRRVLAERKFRLTLWRPSLQVHLPKVLNLRLFLSDAKDFLDSAKCAKWFDLYQKLETSHHLLRQFQAVIMTTTLEEQQLLAFEKALFRDIERGGGAGLVRTLGGSKAAKNKLEQTQAQIQTLRSALRSAKENADRIQVD
jgi:hypothetical protein